MRRKKYFWNLKHHKQLDQAMGLSRPMAEPFKSLADACGMSSELGGTEGLEPMAVFLTFGDKLLRPSMGKIEDMPVYDYHSTKPDFLRNKPSKS